MRKSLALSTAFHVATGAVLVVGLPDRAPIEIAEPSAISVDLVPEDSDTPPAPPPAEAMATAPRPDQVATRAAEPPPPEPRPERAPEAPSPPPPPPPAPEARPAEPPPQPPAPEPVPAQQMAAVQPAPTKPTPPPAPPPRQQARPAEQRPAQPAPQEEDDEFAALLRSVERLDATRRADETTQARGRAPTPAPQPSSRAPVSGSTLTAAELAAIQSQVQEHWFIPAGVQGLGQMRVRTRMRLDRDGSVRLVEIVDEGRMASDPAFRAVAESARRAVLAASPLRFPPEKYETLRDAVVVFTPPLG